ncbi:Uncharacterised protein [Mycobacteroides abscessus subsp. abscessus]|nr:Uncharacterised protein [Mycobacteroides abscessus subsp. abscessus]
MAIIIAVLQLVPLFELQIGIAFAQVNGRHEKRHIS